MKLYKTLSGNFLEHNNEYYLINQGRTEIVNRDDLYNYLENFVKENDPGK